MILFLKACSCIFSFLFTTCSLASIGHNPGIAAMWEDEKQRRRDRGQPSQISIPVSQGGEL